MKCPFCKIEMVKGRISVLDRANYSFYPETYYSTVVKRITNKIVMPVGIRLDKPKQGNVNDLLFGFYLHCLWGIWCFVP